MKRTPWIGLAALAFLIAPPARAAGPAEEFSTALSQVPAKAPLVIQLRGIERTKERLIAMVKEALPELGGQAEEKINEHYKEALEGRSLKAVVKDAPSFCIFSDFPANEGEAEAKRKFAYLIRVTKYADFRDSVLTDEERKAIKKEDGYEVTQIHGEDVFLVDRGDYALVAMSKEAAKSFSKKPAQGLDSKLAKDVAAKFLESDVAAYIDMAAVRSKFGDQIAHAKESLENVIDQAESVGGLQKGQVEMAKRVIGAAFKAGEESQAVLLAAEFRKAGLAIHAQATFGADTKTSQLLKNGKPAALAELGRLPGDMMTYSGIQMGGDLGKDLTSYLFGADTESKDMKAALDELMAAKPRLRLDGTSLPLRGIQVWTYDDPAKAVAAQLKLLRALKAGEKFQAGPIKEPTIKEKAEKHGGFELHAFSAQWDFEKLEEQFGNVPEQFKQIQSAMVKGMLGEQINFWFGTDGKTVVQLMGKNWKDAQTLLDQFQQGKKTIGEQAAYKEARMQLPKEASFLSLVDVPAFAQAMVKSLPLPIGLAGKPKPSYVGLAATAKPEQGSVDLWIPGTTVREIYKAVEPLMKAFGKFGGAS